MSSIDVIIPCYRYARFLQECVESVCSQDIRDLRILIIDDHSPDDTAEVAAELARKDGRITWRRHDANMGHIATYNEGLEWASADYALLLSADDWILPGALARAIQVLDANPEIGFAYGREVKVREGAPRPPELNAKPERGWSIFSGTAFLRMNYHGNPVATCTAVVRTEVQKKIGFYRPELTHSGDMEMWMRFAAHGPVGYVHAYQGAYRSHPKSMSLSYYTRMLLDLRQREAAFDIIFTKYEHLLEQKEALRNYLYQGLAEAALDAANEPFKQADWMQFEELRAFAAHASPQIRKSASWRLRSIERALGPTLWSALRSAAYHLGFGSIRPKPAQSGSWNALGI